MYSFYNLTICTRFNLCQLIKHMLLVQGVFLCEPAKCTCLHLLPTSVFTTHHLADFLFFFFNHNILFLLFNSLQSVDRIRSKVKSRFISLSHTHTYAPLPPTYTYIQMQNPFYCGQIDLTSLSSWLIWCPVEFSMAFTLLTLPSWHQWKMVFCWSLSSSSADCIVLTKIPIPLFWLLFLLW